MHFFSNFSQKVQILTKVVICAILVIVHYKNVLRRTLFEAAYSHPLLFFPGLPYFYRSGRAFAPAGEESIPVSNQDSLHTNTNVNILRKAWNSRCAPLCDCALSACRRSSTPLREVEGYTVPCWCCFFWTIWTVKWRVWQFTPPLGYKPGSCAGSHIVHFTARFV